ncbi:7TM diverse intracellular signaling domain-containing protein [Mucilaginibacter sp.]|uniref:7TM diverse intracellular signaling domain-containing protein n=1 Tax=Mucilaginibacter sp. TaxID=1882438 RepID=UPI0035BC42A7
MLLLAHVCFAQKAIVINADSVEHIFVNKEVFCLEDKSDALSIKDVSSPGYVAKFKPSKDFYPKNYDHNSSYWYRVKINFHHPVPHNNSVFEFFDQTTDQIEAYLPDGKEGFSASSTGENHKFADRLYKHKNFEFLIDNFAEGEHTYYFKVRSKDRVNVIIVYRTFTRFVYYTLTEYITYGMFYGMILIFSFHNLLMYMAVKRRQYLIYIFYILSVGLYEASADGIAFQYLWPNIPSLNDFMYGAALYMISLFALIFLKELLQVKTRNYTLYRVINWTIAVRTVYFAYCLFFDRSLFMYKFIEFVPLAIAFYTGISIWLNGFKPARFFVVGYAVLFAGFIVKGVYVLGLARWLPALPAHYSLSFSFIIEMVFLSFAIGDQVRLFRKDKDKAQAEVMEQMQINVDLKDFINSELENEVKARTHEATEKSKVIHEKSLIIERQNENLLVKNLQLEAQAAEISRMNVLLEKDNIQLKTSIEKVTDARALSTELSFEEFSAKYPDQEACFKLLADLKWMNGYQCIRCNNTTYCNGRSLYSRRCTKCAYEETVLHNTIFQNNRIPINKAFYLVYLVYASKGTISSRQLSEKLGIRQSTCWAYSNRIKKALDEQKRVRKKNSKQGWMDLVLDTA